MITFEVDPDKKFAKAVAIAAAKVDDLTAPFREITRSWYQSNKAIFSLKGPGKYDDLAPSTKAFKTRHLGSPYPILKMTGRLEDSMTKQGNESINFITNKKTLTLGTSTPYAGYLQGGTKNMPARPFVLIGAEQAAPREINKRRELWIKQIEDYVLQVTKEMAK